MKMKNKLITISLSSGFAFALAFAAWLTGTALAQDATKPMKPMKDGEHQLMLNTPAQACGMEMMNGKMIERCQEMMKEKQKMKEDMKAHDAELTEHVAKMNSAPEDKKMDLMATVITHMVDQRIAMDARKAMMEEEMMQHMMQHMADGQGIHGAVPDDEGNEGHGRKIGGSPQTTSTRTEMIVERYNGPQRNPHANQAGNAGDCTSDAHSSLPWRRVLARDGLVVAQPKALYDEPN